MLGNHSKDAKSWLNGPTHLIRKQSVPGYLGFVPGLKSENMIAKTYANNTATSYSGAIERGFESSTPERFKSISQTDYNTTANRRIA